MPFSGLSSGSVELLHLSWLLPGFALRDVIFCFPSLFISLLKPVGIRPCSESALGKRVPTRPRALIQGGEELRGSLDALGRVLDEVVVQDCQWRAIACEFSRSLAQCAFRQM